MLIENRLGSPWVDNGEGKIFSGNRIKTVLVKVLKTAGEHAVFPGRVL